ncbi:MULTISPECIES: DNA polymerase Y family protein [unclassified Pseudomonas]|uniref:Y-family DNA polymerase n=1 Tax=unclassified Pseudomonas TaxID=196821 RepID=UPI002AC93FB8|nr:MULTISPECIES: DNA polymerase Y family protein [unclassified Pseudomonas]MEB0048103.1 DNA polymerase Y family protein [Pseudomonas sp. Dout3]MEB0098767.1 DNA polymerase Y family protein [Pseudomonas sp. DC1.2]WPX56730.1 DNA polymerase Y family protein [Pseudomonas sp. DC1.2]
MRWVCILFPQLAMDAVLRQRPNPDEPLVLLTGPAQRRVLQAVNGSARALGLRPGQSMTAAQALSKGFVTAEYDAAEIEHWQQFLAAWAYRFSAQVSVHYPRAVVFEIESSLGLFGAWPQFETRLRAELTGLGFRHRIVAAPNPVAARVLANVYDGLVVPDDQALGYHLGQLPIDRIALEPTVATALSRMGLRTLSQVQALPRHTLARRFEAQVLKHLDTLLGLRHLALAFYLPPDRFDVRIELNFDVQSHQALLFPLRRLTGDLSAFLCGRDRGVQRFDLLLEHAGLPDTRIKVGLLSAERDPAMLFELARGRLEQVQVEAPVRGFRLCAEDLPSFVPQRQELFDDRAQQSLPWEQLRERLRARLGDDAVQGLRFQADHRPECAWQASVDSQFCGGLPRVQRPGWLLSEPLAVHEGSTRILMGPERIESGWWDGDDVRRDYYLIETRSGQQGWAYRTVGEGGHLWLQGWFA